MSDPVVPYDLLGGEAELRALVQAFYRQMKTSDEAPGLKAMHKKDTTDIENRLFKYLSSWLGGPSLFMEERGSMCITDAHRPFRIGQKERDEWLRCWDLAMDEVGVPDEFRDMVKKPMFRVADMLRNQPESHDQDRVMA